MKAFEAGVICGFELWDLLTISCDMGWAGSFDMCQTKKHNLIQDVLAKFNNTKGKQVYADELEDMLTNRVLSDFNTMAEDGSVEWIAKLITTLYQDCMVKKDFTGLEKILAIKGQKPTIEGNNSDDENNDTMADPESLESKMEGMTVAEEEETQEVEPEEPAAPLVDEDGFETVTRRGKKRGGRRR